MKPAILTALLSVLTLGSISTAQAYPNSSNVALPEYAAHYYNNGGFMANRLPAWGNPYGYGGGYGYHHCHRRHHRWFY
jgi:hypothetical protein